mgnify:FL=1
MENPAVQTEDISFDQLEGIMGNLADGFVLTDKDSRVVYMNKSAEDIFEFHFQPDNPVLFKQIGRLMNLETQESFFCPVSRAIQEDKTVGLSKNIGIMHQYEPVFLSATCSPRHNKKGEVIGCSAVFRDISKLRGIAHKVESDQYYMRSVFEAAKIGICSLNIRGEIVEVNESALEILGGTYQEVIGRQFGDVFQCVNCVPYGCGKGDKCKFCIIRNNIEAAVLDDSFSSEYVAAVITKASEEPVWLQFFLTQVWKENEKQIVLTMIDISRRKQREKELMEARRMAEVASNTKTQFLANMSHEIRTPINGMTGMINLTLRTELNPEQRENLQAAKQCSEDLLKIINDILDYAKLENGKMTIEHIDLDLHGLLHRVAAVHANLAEGKGLKFMGPDCTNLPHYIKGDPLRLRQILHNLLTNAIKFTSAGTITLGCTIARRGIRTMLEFYVEDTGIGMSREEQERLFKPFSQVDGSTTRKFGGTGLGLTIVKELVTAMYGEIHVMSSPGVGSRFTFVIPLKKAEKADMELKDQSVFLNPYMNDIKAEALPPELEKLESSEKIEKSVSLEPDDDIMDLLKYCEDKLNS